MELKEAILNRRTVRKFKDKAVSEKLLLELLEAGSWAPSHGNKQPWEFLLLGDETRKRLSASYRNAMEAGPLKDPQLPEERTQSIRDFAQNFGNAPVLLVVSCLAAETDLDKYDFPLAAAAAIQNILLVAWEKQIAGVWLSYGSSPAVPPLLGLTEDVIIAGILALGYPEEIPLAQPRTDVRKKLRKLP